MVERSERRREMKAPATTRMLLTTALLAAVAVLLASPAQAFWMDVEGGGGTGTATAAPAPALEPGAIPYLSHGIGVDESLFAGQSAVTIEPGAIPYLSQGVGVDESLFAGQQRVLRDDLRFDGSPDAIDRYVANQQSSTPALGGSPDAIDRYMGRTSVAAQSGTTGNDFDWTWVGLGAGFCALLAAAMTGLYLSARHRGRVALP